MFLESYGGEGGQGGKTGGRFCTLLASWLHKELIVPGQREY